MEDLVGQKFNHLTAIRPGPDKIYPSGRKRKTWYCVCDCQLELPEPERKLVAVTTISLKNGSAKSCGCRTFYNSKTEIDWTNYQWGKLTAIRKVRKPEKLKSGGAYWECQCECGRTTILRSADITRHQQISCGQCSVNAFDLSGDFGIGMTSNEEIFSFDKEDFDIIKQYSWCKTSDGYIMAWDKERKRFVYMHRLLVGLIDDKQYVVDHVNHHTTDNKKENLRICTHRENIINSKIGKNNTSGVVGVRYELPLQKWSARIMVNGKNLYLGVFSDFAEAVQARKTAEIKYFGEFAYNYKGD